MRIIGVLLGLLVLATGFMFASLNAEPVSIQYLVGTSQVSLSVLVLLLLSVGVGLGSLFSGLAYLRLKLHYRRLKKQLGLLEDEVSKLRLLSVRET